MAPVFQPRPSLDRPEATKPKGLTRETINQIKAEILGIKPVGYQSPPVHTQFQKGQSGNPKGRPRKAPPPETPSLPIEQSILAEAERLVQIRENGESKEM